MILAELRRRDADRAFQQRLRRRVKPRRRLVEDDDATRTFLADNLTADGFDVPSADPDVVRLYRAQWDLGELAMYARRFADPRDDGYFQGDVYPEGPWRPEQGVQRGSVMDMPIHPGDPLTPGWASTPGARRISRNDAPSLPRIRPV